MKNFLLTLLLCTATSGTDAMEHNENNLFTNRLSEKERQELLLVLSCIDLVGEQPNMLTPTQLPNKFGCQATIADYKNLYKNRHHYTQEEFEKKKLELKRNAFGVMQGYSLQEKMNREKAQKAINSLNKRLQSTHDPKRAEKIKIRIEKARRYQDKTRRQEKEFLNTALQARFASPRNVSLKPRRMPKSRVMRRRSARKLDSKIFDL